MVGDLSGPPLKRKPLRLSATLARRRKHSSSAIWGNFIQSPRTRRLTRPGAAGSSALTRPRLRVSRSRRISKLNMIGLQASPHPRYARRVCGAPSYSSLKIQRNISPRRFYLRRSSPWAIMPGEGACSVTGLTSRRIRDGLTWRLSPEHLCALPRMRGHLRT